MVEGCFLEKRWRIESTKRRSTDLQQAPGWEVVQARGPGFQVLLTNIVLT